MFCYCFVYVVKNVAVCCAVFQDENDNRPVFSRTSYSGSVTENLAPGNVTVCTVLNYEAVAFVFVFLQHYLKLN